MAILSFLVSLFHSILLLFKLAAISILWMILAEAFGYTTSTQTIKRVVRVRRRKLTVPLSAVYAHTNMAATRAVPGLYTQTSMVNTMPIEHISSSAPASTPMSNETTSTSLPSLAARAVTAPKKQRPSSKDEPRRPRTISISSSRSSRSSSSGSSTASSSRSSSRSKTASVSSTTAHVSSRRASRTSSKHGKDRGKAKERSTERINGWRRERSSSGASRIGIF